MAESSRMIRRRESSQRYKDDWAPYKRPMAFLVFLLVSLAMAMGTFLTPAFMKGAIKSESNTVVVSKMVNSHFNRLATIVGGSSDDENLISDEQARAVEDLIIDYKYGWHFLHTDDTRLANSIKKVILVSEKTDSSQVASVRKKLGKQKSSATYIVANAFDLAGVMLEANIVTIVRIINLLAIAVCLIALQSLLSDAFGRIIFKSALHEAMAGLMWAGFFMMLVYGLLAMIPILMDTSVIAFADFGYWLEIASGVFLDFVIAGAIIFVISAIPWQASARDS